MRVLLAVALLAFGAEVSAEPILRCEVREAGWPKAAGRFWLGLRNTSSAAVYACVQSRSHSWTRADGEPGGGAAGGVTHACSTDAEFHLILPRESVQLLWVAEPPVGVDRATLALRADVQIRRDGAEDARPSSVECTYEWKRVPRQ